MPQLHNQRDCRFILRSRHDAQLHRISLSCSWTSHPRGMQHDTTILLGHLSFILNIRSLHRGCRKFLKAYPGRRRKLLYGNSFQALRTASSDYSSRASIGCVLDNTEHTAEKKKKREGALSDEAPFQPSWFDLPCGNRFYLLRSSYKRLQFTGLLALIQPCFREENL